MKEKTVRKLKISDSRGNIVRKARPLAKASGNRQNSPIQFKDPDGRKLTLTVDKASQTMKILKLQSMLLQTLIKLNLIRKLTKI